MPAVEQLPPDHPESEHVPARGALRFDVRAGEQLPRCHVGYGPEHPRERRPVLPGRLACDAEVDDFRLLGAAGSSRKDGRHEHVVRLEIAVHDAPPVEVGERACDVPERGEPVRTTEALLPERRQNLDRLDEIEDEHEHVFGRKAEQRMASY